MAYHTCLTYAYGEINRYSIRVKPINQGSLMVHSHGLYPQYSAAMSDWNKHNKTGNP